MPLLASVLLLLTALVPVLAMAEPVSGNLPLLSVVSSAVKSLASGLGLLGTESIGTSGLDEAKPVHAETFAFENQRTYTFTAPYTGEYVLEVWGAQGSSSLDGIGGKGGYAKGTALLSKGDTLYIVVGGTNGYNGGGTGQAPGGGATHIAKSSGLLSSFAQNQAAVLIVAGGGGGAERVDGGSGGGDAGGNGNMNYGNLTKAPTGGTQTRGGEAGVSTSHGTGGSGTFGQGGTGMPVAPGTDAGSGGGGGWYGGGGIPYAGGAGGGSGHISGELSQSSWSSGVQSGNGKASITMGNELIVDPNGGAWPDENGLPQTTPQSYTAFSGTKRIADPTRSGYRFVGWIEVGAGRLTNVKGTDGDGAFADGNNQVVVYNNVRVAGVQNTAVTHTRVSTSTPYGDQLIRISHSATLESQPQLGGFHIAKQAYVGQTYLMIFSAKVPQGYYLQHSTNYIGENAVETWLTDRKGTGEWRTYAYTIKVGTPAAGQSLSTTGHIFLTRDPTSEWGSTTKTNLGNAAEAVSWDVAYAEFYDITNGNTYDFSTGASRLIAQWEPVSYKVRYHYQDDDDYKAGQADTLGVGMDMSRDVRVTGTVSPRDSSSDVLLLSTADGSNGMVLTSEEGTYVASDGTTTSRTASPVSGGSHPFTFNWDSVAHLAYLTSDSTQSSLTLTQRYDGLSGASENEVRIGAADWSRTYDAAHVSGVVMTIPYDIDEAFSMPHPTRIGYKFLGWDTKEDGTGTRYAANQSMTNLVSEGETNLYAQWELRSYVVSFDANGGAGAMPSQDFMWNEEKGLSHCSMLRFNWKFTGWNTEADGSGTSYEDDEVVRNILEKPVVTENDYRITLYAQWEKVSNTSQIEDGLWEIRVPAWGKVSVSNLPAGASFEVVEQPQQDWVLTSQENTSGTIVPRVTEVAKFQNEYRPNETSLALAATKTLNGTSPVGSDFSFTLSGADEQTTAKLETSLSGSGTETVSNNGGGIQFSPVVYSRDDIGKTFTYLIQEVEGDDPTIAYTTVTKTVTVSVTTGTTGLVATATYPDLEGQTAIFANRTKPGSLRVAKEVTRGTDAAREKNLFPVTVALSDSLGTPMSGNYEVTRNGITVAGAEFDAEGKATVSIADGDELVVSGIPAGTRYSVSESYPEWFRQAEAEGTDGVIQPDTQSETSFANEYLVSGQATIVAEKHLLGATLTEDEFSFRLLDENGDVIGTSTNKADGTVEFPLIPYGAEDDGKTYRYIITEDDDGREDIVYDERELGVSVSVSDEDGTGELTVSVTYDDPDGATFENEKLVEMATTGGDGTRVMPWLVIAVVAAFLFLRVLPRRRQR